MKNRMQENIKNNPILGNPSSNIMEVNEEVIRLQNEASKNLHTNFGFDFIGIMKEVGFKFDRYVDVFMYQKTLK